MIDLIEVSKLDDRNKNKAIEEVLKLTMFNTLQYPEYLKWYYTKAIPRLFNNTGEIVIELDNFFIKGLSVLKKTENETKLCTLYVDDMYRNNGLGESLLAKSFDILETSKPKLTIPEHNLKQFSHFIDIYDWKSTEIINDYNSTEIIFN